MPVVENDSDLAAYLQSSLAAYLWQSRYCHMNKTPLVEVRESKIAGRGVFALVDFMPGDTVLKWNPRALLTERDLRTVAEEEKPYISRVAQNQYLLMGTPERFVNHSCIPNTVVNNDSDIALRHIKAGEEITSDYGDYPLLGFECCCGLKECRGFIGTNKIF